jgi:hypothetical protein
MLRRRSRFVAASGALLLLLALGPVAPTNPPTYMS